MMHGPVMPRLAPAPGRAAARRDNISHRHTLVMTLVGRGEAPGLPPRTPTKRRCLLELRQGQWPLEPFILVVEWEGADPDHSRSLLALSHFTANGQIAKRLALCWA
jgi:hypothetical protein